MTFDLKVIAVIYNKFRCNLHSIGNHCVKHEHHEHPRSKNERGVSITSRKTDFKNVLT